jgi:hypothetical protein
MKKEIQEEDDISMRYGMRCDFTLDRLNEQLVHFLCEE